MDNIRNRVRQAMEWLKDNRLFNSNRVIAEKMGYNPSVVSQVITGKSKVRCNKYGALLDCLKKVRIVKHGWDQDR
jgi:hypothetical protein